MKAAGKTIIITSHYLPEIEAIADRIMLLKDGRFVFQGSFAVLQKQYQQVEIRCQTRLPADRFTNFKFVIRNQTSSAGPSQGVRASGR
ncbi:hypothetical protein WP50_29640 [Lactiplantibacillus plantarum]|nr:hypothetical protein WP50_29640 [Lactiplantibacillus plantarum]